MNRKQRDQNRATAENLRNGNVCPECGERTKCGHFVPPMLGTAGFYTCDKFYGADGSRINGQN